MDLDITTMYLLGGFECWEDSSALHSLEHDDDVLTQHKEYVDIQNRIASVTYFFSEQRLSQLSVRRDERIMAQGLIAASAENPELIAPAQHHVEAVFTQLGKAKTTATSARTIFLASQGLQFLELLGLLSLSAAERNEIRRHLKTLTEELAPC